MKKQKRLVALGLTAAMAAGLISGCATKATPENLLRDMQKNAEKTESALLNFKMEMAMGDGTTDGYEYGDNDGTGGVPRKRHGLD